MIAIRQATLVDAKRLLEIYDYYVKNTAITFEYDTPSLVEFQSRMERTMKRYPYLVAMDGQRVEGYAYAGILKERAAYQYSCELSIYLDHNARHKGMGRKLYETLTYQLEAMGIRNLYVCIAYPEKEDEYLTTKSVDFHAHLGFEKVGEFHRCGYKFGREYNIVWMEKRIGGSHVTEL